MCADRAQVAAVAQGDVYVYEVLNMATLETQLASSFIVPSPMTTAGGLYARFKPSTVATLHSLLRTPELYLNPSC